MVKCGQSGKKKSPPYNFQNFDDFKFSSIRGFQKYKNCKRSLILDLNQIWATVRTWNPILWVLWFIADPVGDLILSLANDNNAYYTVLKLLI